jgi:hypothetical protein
MVSRLDRCHIHTDRFDDTGALMSKDDGKSTLRILARQSVGIWLDVNNPTPP